MNRHSCVTRRPHHHHQLHPSLPPHHTHHTTPHHTTPSLRLLHPLPRTRTVLAWTPCAVLLPAPVAGSDQVRKALFSFPSTSGAGRSGLRLSHVREALRPASSDLLLRLLSEVVCLMLQGEVPEAVRPYVCGASIMALRKPNGLFGLSLWVRPSAVLQARLSWMSSRSVHVSFWGLFSLWSRLRTDARLSSTLPASGSTATVPMRARLHSLLTFPTRSTRFTGRQCCGLFVFISLRLLRGLTAVIVMTASSSLAPPRRLLKSFPAHGAFSRAILLARFSSHLPSTLLFWRPVLPRTPCTRVGLIFALFTSTAGSALIRGFRSVGLEVNLDKTEVIPACSSSQSFTPGDFQGCAWVGSGVLGLV